MLFSRVVSFLFVVMIFGAATPSLAAPGCATVNNIYRCTDIVYSNVPLQTLDIYRPSANGLYPTIIYVHGGSWFEGDKSLMSSDPTDVLRQVAKGYAVVSINYRLVDGSAATSAPGALLDVKRAVKWVKAVGASTGLDATRVILWGHSAGGHLASLAAATAKDAATEPDGFAHVDSAVNLVFSFAGVYDFSQSRGPLPQGLLRSAAAYLGCNPPNHNDKTLPKCSAAQLAKWSPASVITADDPRVVLIHNRSDMAVPYSQMESYHHWLTHFRKQPVQCDAKVEGIASHVEFKGCNAVVDFMLAVLVPPGPRK